MNMPRAHIQMKLTTLRLRLIFFLLLLVFTMSAGVVVILIITGTFSAGLTQSKQLLLDELGHAQENVSSMYGDISVQAISFSRELTQRIEKELADEHKTLNELSDQPQEIEHLISELFERTFYSLQKAKCSGAFLVLDTTVNTSLENSQYSKASLYLKNMEPNIISSTSPSFTLLYGFPNIGRSNSIALHTQWNMEFDVSDAPFYSVPIATAVENPTLPLSKLYYWSDPYTLPGTSEEVMLCSVPLIGARNIIYGVCGFEISTMLFKLSNMPDNSTYSRMFSMLVPMTNGMLATSRSMVAGGYTAKEISKIGPSLYIKESKRSFTTYGRNNDNLYLGYHMRTQLYPSASPYSDHVWVTAVMVPKEDIVESITRLNIILACLLILLITTGILISIVFSNRYVQPISQGIAIIKSANPQELPKTNVQEIDDLITYLAQYKNDLNQRIEKDR